MINKILYTLFFIWIRLHALLPMRTLYFLSELLFFLIYRIVRYRVSVVRKNMRNSFPEKNKSELKKLERRFYRHFSDYIVESIKLAGISEKELLQRAHITNPELVFDLKDRGHTCIILLMGHYGNWEWFSGTAGRFKNAFKLNFLYKPLTNKAVDRIFLHMRTRFASFCLKKSSAAKEIIRIKRSGEPSLIIFIADQMPGKANSYYRTTFLRQDTAMLTGAERIACKLDLPIVFCDMRQIKRGYYEVDFRLIAEKLSATQEFEITEKFARMMEKTILRDPALWLWTHKRWKHKFSNHTT